MAEKQYDMIPVSFGFSIGGYAEKNGEPTPNQKVSMLFNGSLVDHTGKQETIEVEWEKDFDSFREAVLHCIRVMAANLGMDMMEVYLDRSPAVSDALLAAKMHADAEGARQADIRDLDIQHGDDLG